MEIKRDSYLNRIKSFMWDGQVKVITGIRRCGKSYLLRRLFRNYLVSQGTPEDHILSYELDLARDIRFRNPLDLAKTVRERVERSPDPFYLFVDEIQMSDDVPNPYNSGGRKITFYDALNDLNSLPNLDVYVTGSNSKFLSSDIITEFRGRGDQVRVHPLSFAEYHSAIKRDWDDDWDDYMTYGGILFGNTNNEKKSSLFGNTNNEKKSSLFGNTNNDNKTPLFGNINIDNKTPLFGNNSINDDKTSLFGNINNDKKTSLFGNTNNDIKNSLFGNK